MLHPDTVAMNDRCKLLKACNVPLDLSNLGRHSDQHIEDVEDIYEADNAEYCIETRHPCFDCGAECEIGEGGAGDNDGMYYTVTICLYCRSPICDECYTGDTHMGGIDCRHIQRRKNPQ